MTQYCELPECDTEIEQTERGPGRRFCCPQHRTALRAARRRSGSSILPSPLPRRGERPEPGPSIRALVEAAYEDGPHVPVPARGVRGADAGPGPVELGGWSPSAPAPASTAASPARRERGGSRPGGPATPRGPAFWRRPRLVSARSVVTAGIAVAVVLGGGSMVWDQAPSLPPGAAEGAPQPAAGTTWVPATNVALASVDRQLAQGRDVLARWQALPAGRRDQRPMALRALEQRMASMERQRAVLVSRLASWQNLQQTTTALAQAEQSRVALGAPTPSAVRPSPSADAAALQQETVDNQIAVLRQQLDLWQRDVAAAMNAPVLSGQDGTSPLVRALVELIEHPDRGKPLPPRVGGDSALAAAAQRIAPGADWAPADSSSGAPPRPGADGPVSDDAPVLIAVSTPTSRSGGGADTGLLDLSSLAGGAEERDDSPESSPVDLIRQGQRDENAALPGSQPRAGDGVRTLLPLAPGRPVTVSPIPGPPVAKDAASALARSVTRRLRATPRPGATAQHQAGTTPTTKHGRQAARVARPTSRDHHARATTHAVTGGHDRHGSGDHTAAKRAGSRTAGTSTRDTGTSSGHRGKTSGKTGHGSGNKGTSTGKGHR